MGSDLITRLVSMSLYERRSILSSFCDDHLRPTVETVLGVKVTTTEWRNIRLHHRYPGPHKKIIKPKLYWQKNGSMHLHRLLDFLNQPSYLQRLSFGTKVLSVMDGKDYQDLDNISRAVRLSKIDGDFLMALDQETIYSDSLPSSELRCQCLEKGTFRGCLHERNHQVGGISKKFIVKGSIPTRTIEESVKTLTSGQIKALSGLGDTKEIKGRNFFEDLRTLPKKYEMDQEKMKQLLKKIDHTEIFYQTDYGAHLSRHYDYTCECITCGYSVR